MRLFGIALALAMGLTSASFAVPPRNLAKTRPNAMLKKDKLWDEAPDVRGEFERRRDDEVALHYTRLAELDRMAAIADAEDDMGLREDIEAVRRKEVQRFQLAMMKLNADARAWHASGGLAR